MPQDNKKEWFFEVDEHDRVIGRMSRAEAHNGSMRIHRSVAILVFDTDKSHMLMQKRTAMKDMDANLWTYAVGGHVTYGDKYDTTAVREVREELGIADVQLHFLARMLQFCPGERESNAVFETTIPRDTPLHPDSTEVQATQWIEVGKLKEFISAHPINFDTKQVLTLTGFL